MRHIAILTTSYPDNIPGSEAAGSFVGDFARELYDTAHAVTRVGDTLSVDGQFYLVDPEIFISGP